MKKVIYAGTFDPFTKGHEDIVKRSLKIFDEVTILVAVSPSKKPLFEIDQRVKMISECFSDKEKVLVDSWEGLIVDYAKKFNFRSVVRGLRPTGDFEIEFQMASMNKALYPEIDTIFLPTGGDHYFVSSSLVKEIYKHGGDISDFVPPRILEYINNIE